MSRMSIVSSPALRRAALLWIAAALGLVSVATVARESVPAAVSAAALPPEARTTLTHIRAGGPFPYSRDGVVFNNRERLLPAKPYGYYHEYTVPTPQSRTRGARRIVCGGTVGTLSECYYSDDHYRSFRKIQP
jgi:ribonuclease T1